jgi:hypothetical protein
MGLEEIEQQVYQSTYTNYNLKPGELAIIRRKMAYLLRILNNMAPFPTKFVVMIVMRGFERSC